MIVFIFKNINSEIFHASAVKCDLKKITTIKSLTINKIIQFLPFVLFLAFCKALGAGAPVAKHVQHSWHGKGSY